jgi:hypothetical protein
MALMEVQIPPISSVGGDGEQPLVNGVLDRHPPSQVAAVKKNMAEKTIPADLSTSKSYYDTTSINQYSIPMNEQLAFTPRKLRVITVGAGFSGLMMAHKFQHRFPDMDKIVQHTIFEKRSDVGGTWLVNTYPGVQCDVPSHIYVSPPSRYDG